MTNSAFTINGTLQVGASATTTSGVMDFNGKNVTFGTNSVLRLGVRRAYEEDMPSGAMITNINRLTINGTVSVFVSDSHSLAVGDEVVLWDAQTTTGTPKLDNYVVDAEAKLYWDDKDLAKGILRVTDVVPVGIATITNELTKDAPIYRVDGRRVFTLDPRTLAPGIYIQNGRKFLVK